MANGQPTKTGKELGKKEDILEDSLSSQNLDPMPLGESEISQELINATTQIVSKKIWRNKDLQELRSKIGLVAGALADFQEAGGKISMEVIEYELPSGIRNTGIKLLLCANDVNLVAEETTDGIDLNIVAESEEE
jgi:hypothetical protein